MSASRGEMFIVSAPSGAGKTTLIHELLEGRFGAIGGIEFSVSHTTRSPRHTEQDGVDYHFIDRAAFEELVAAGGFLEWAEVHGNLYGTSMREVASRLEAGVDVLLEIDVQGAEQILRRSSEAHAILVLPPSLEALRRRLELRGQDDPAEMARRLAVSRWEIERYGLYEYVIINDDLGRAGQRLAAIILEKRQRRERMEGEVQAILADFAAVADE